MKEITTLKEINNQGTWYFLFLSVITMGVYPLMWAWKNTDLFNKEMNAQIKPNIFLAIAILYFIASIFEVFSWASLSPFGQDTAVSLVFDLISSLIYLTATICWSIWALQMKKALEFYAITEFGLNLKLNVFWAFLFQHLYINYCINDLENHLVKQQILEVARKKQHDIFQNPQTES